MSENSSEVRSLALTPTWSVATVLTIFVAVSLLVERSIHRLSNWLKKTRRGPLFEALEKMKEELMLLGFISLLLTASSRTISSICIDSKFYDSKFSPCDKSEIEEGTSDIENSPPHSRKQLLGYALYHSFRRMLGGLNQKTCSEGHEPFVSYEGLEQLHRFIFVMAITHVSYSCLTMLLAIIKIHTWRKWEDEAHRDRYDSYAEITKALTMRRQSTFLNVSNPWSRNCFLVWLTCFFRQFGRSVVRADYLTLRRAFIMNHHLSSTYDFHSYMIRSMEEEFKMIVGVSGPLWGFVIAFMLFNINGSNLYFWIAIIPVTLVLLVGAKLQHVIATLALESVSISGLFTGAKLNPRDDLFWFKKPELLLYLIHFILFQNAFELASFFWFWWQFSYNSCFLRNHQLVYMRLILGFAGQFLCSYSTLPLYALVTQMGSNYKAALIPRRIRETMHGWGKAARKRSKHRRSIDDSTTIRTETSTVCSLEEGDQELFDHPSETPFHHPSEIPYNPSENPYVLIELQPTTAPTTTNTTASTTPLIRHHSELVDEDSNHRALSQATPLLQSISVPTSPALTARRNEIARSFSMPHWKR